MVSNNSFFSKSILFLIFLIGIYSGVYLWDNIFLPFHNPWNVVGHLTKLQFNPANNTLRFVIFILLPSALFIGIYFFKFRKWHGINLCPASEESLNLRRVEQEFISCSSSFSKLHFILWIILAIVAALNLRTFGASGPLDTFHEGETLGASISYLSGQTPYKDFLFVHGLYQDPLRSVLAFKIFGKSIASVRTLESIGKVFAWIAFTILILKIYRNRYQVALPSLILFFLLQDDFLPELFQAVVTPLMFFPRDFISCLYLLLIIRLKQNLENQIYKSRTCFLLSTGATFISVSAFAYSIDRGYFLVATHLLASIFLLIVYFHKASFKKDYILGLFTGSIIAIGLLGFLLRWNFRESFDFVFRIMSSSKELMDGRIFSIHQPAHLMICSLIAANTFWLTFCFLQTLYPTIPSFRVSKQALSKGRLGEVHPIKSFFGSYFIELCLLALSVFFFRSALGRADWVHISFNAWPTYLLTAYILSKEIRVLHTKKKFTTLPQPILVKEGQWLALLLFFGIALGSFRIFKNDLLAANFPRKSDQEFIPSQYQHTIDFLKKNLSDKEDFLT